jgi:hypothetical protein
MEAFPGRLSNQDGDNVREAIGVFKTADAQEAIDDLMVRFGRADISLLAAERQSRKQGTNAARLQARTMLRLLTAAVSLNRSVLLKRLDWQRIYVMLAQRSGPSPSGGTLAAAIAGATAAAGAGGFVGAVLAKFVGDRHAQHLEEQLEHGGLLLWVRTWNAEDEKRAVEILRKHSGRDVHVHSLPVD